MRIQNDLIQKDTTLWINSNQDVFSIRVNFQPETVLVDPDRWVLMMLENGEDGVVAGNKVPDDFRLLQNYPNPFNVSTTIYFDIPYILTNNKVRMILYDTSGKKIRTLLDEYKNPGRYWLRWNCRDDRNKVVSSGLYISMLE